MGSFFLFSSPYWRNVERTLESAPLILRNGTVQWMVNHNVAARLLRSRLNCVERACRDSEYVAARRLRTMLVDLDIETVLHGLTQTLLEAVLIVGASVGVGTAVGAGVGAFFGGIGALPGGTIGAALGAEVGTWILGVLGLKALAEFFIDGLPGILRSYSDGFTLAWQAGYDEVTDHGNHEAIVQYSRLQGATGRIADGHVAMVMLLLGAIVAYLSRGRGDIQALARQARSGRLGEEFANWLVKNEAKLRAHPRLQPRSERPSAAGGEPPPPSTPPRPRRDDEEPRGPRRMMRKRVRCFKAEGLHWSKLPEFDRQLKGQESGLNDMTVDEYIKGRTAFDEGEVTRSSSAAKKARVQYARELTRDLTDKLQGEGLSPAQAEQKAIEIASEKMKTLAALHNPDMVSGGRDVISDFGDRSVNSSIGAQWGNGRSSRQGDPHNAAMNLPELERGGKISRLTELDNAARAVPENERAMTKMNAALERCK